MFWKPRPKIGQGLTEAEKSRRASQAERLLADDVLNEALDQLASIAFDEILRLDPSPDNDRARAIQFERVRLIKDFRQQLSTYVAVGTVAKRRG